MEKSTLNEILVEKELLWIKRKHSNLLPIFNDGYFAIYNEKRLQAECVIERLTDTIMKRIPTIRRKNRKFKSCDRISKDHRGVPLHPTKIDFKNNSRYIKGHIAAAANHTSNESEYRATFSFINVLPEAKDLIALQKLEEETRDLTYSYEEVFVISGPLHENTDIMLLNGRIPIPTHMFKVVICVEKGVVTKSTNYKIPNKCQTGISKIDIDTSDYEFDLAEINHHLTNIGIVIPTIHDTFAQLLPGRVNHVHLRS